MSRADVRRETVLTNRDASVRPEPRRPYSRGMLGAGSLAAVAAFALGCNTSAPAASAPTGPTTAPTAAVVATAATTAPTASSPSASVPTTPTATAPAATATATAVATVAPTASSASATPAQGDVQVLRGGAHTVYHSIAPLPTSESPRGDGRPMLVWFSGTWCTTCASMESYANPTIEKFASRMAFAEKSVDHDRAATQRFAVRGTPTFVLIDARGQEIGRFLYQPNAAQMEKTLDTALKAKGF